MTELRFSGGDSSPLIQKQAVLKMHMKIKSSSFTVGMGSE